MIDLKFTKERFAHHFYYAKWLYLVMIATGAVIFSLIFTITAPVVPKELKIDINIIGGVLQESTQAMWEEDILAALSEDQQEVNLYSLGIGSGEDAFGGYQAIEVIAARMAAREDDIYILSKKLYENLSQQGAFLLLDDLENLYEYAEGINIEEYKLNNEEETDLHLFGLPLDNAIGLAELGIDPRGQVIAILVYTENEANALKAVDFIMNKMELPPLG